ncbi:TetR/AcrR family transcriptional regulator [Frankia nepalensis]|nr:TetR/AcrR family transcriptional regulator [Frankia nepalensis]
MSPGGSQAIKQAVKVDAGATGRPLRRDAERNRERILAAARELFTEQGLGVGVDEIARRAGVGMGTLYRRFPNKDALVEETLLTAVGQVRELAAAAIAAEPRGQALREFLMVSMTDDTCRWAFVSHRLWTGRTRAAVAGEVVPLISTMFADAQATGAVRGDAVLADLIVLLRALRVVMELSEPSTGTWRRYVGLMLDALRPSEHNSPLDEPSFPIDWLP